MEKPYKVAITHGRWGIRYDGFGLGDRKYSIHKNADCFFASFISGDGQPITTTGKSPMEALGRAELLQEWVNRDFASAT